MDDSQNRPYRSLPGCQSESSVCRRLRLLRIVPAFDIIRARLEMWEMSYV